MATQKLIVELIGDDRSLQRALGRSQDSTTKFGRAFGTVAKGVGFAAVGIGAAVAFGLKKSIDSANEHAKALAQTQAVIKSTGGAANVTAKQMLTLADSIEKTTGVDDLAIQQGENLLATFTNIRNEVGKGNDIFTQATNTIADMSVALGQDTKSSAIQLGKALQDPVRGVTALRRVGVAFTDAQQKQIKSLVASGKSMQAQKLILRELNKEFGGSAKAAGQTLPGQLNILKARLDDVAQRIGEKLVPALVEVVDWVNLHWPQISAVFETVFNAIGDAWVALKPTLTAIFNAFRRAVEYVRLHWPEISHAVSRVAEDIQIIWAKIGPTLTAVFKVAVATIIPLIKSVAQILRGVARIIDGIVHGDWAEAWNGLKDVVVGVFKALKTLIIASFKNLGILLAALVLAPVNAVIDAINKFKIPGLPAVKVGGRTIVPGTPSIDPIPHIGHVGLSSHSTTNVDVYIDGHKTRPNRVVTSTSQRRGRQGGLPLDRSSLSYGPH